MLFDIQLNNPGRGSCSIYPEQRLIRIGLNLRLQEWILKHTGMIYPNPKTYEFPSYASYQEYSLPNVIAHEALHQVIYNEESANACNMLDNVDQYGTMTMRYGYDEKLYWELQFLRTQWWKIFNKDFELKFDLLKKWHLERERRSGLQRMVDKTNQKCFRCGKEIDGGYSLAEGLLCWDCYARKELIEHVMNIEKQNNYLKIITIILLLIIVAVLSAR